MSKKIEVNIWSDIACPWCYVGEASFKLACKDFLKNNPEYTINPIFHAYIIDQGTKKEGEDYLAYNIRRWGGDGWTGELKEAGKKYGLKFGNWKIWPNTILCHTLVSAAAEVGKANEVLEKIFESCYELGKNVSLESTLNEIANEFCIKDWNNKKNMEKALNDDRRGKDELRISGVPYFIFPNDKVINGAAAKSSFLNALNNSK